MKHSLDFSIHPQPTDSTCGPTCLHAVYRYWEDPISLEQTITEIGELSIGGTLAVQLACHALRRGYQATIYSYNLQLFDPSWFRTPDVDLADKLRQQYEHKRVHPGRGSHDQERLHVSTELYLEFLRLGGQIQMPKLNETLLMETLLRGIPILCGLSATYLYRERRERSQPPDASGRTSAPDDVGGDPVGHFVVLYGYDLSKAQVLIADPLLSNPLGEEHTYAASLAKVSAAIFLGIVTYDANLLTIAPMGHDKGMTDGHHLGHGSK
jgi:hypothetical protein